MGKGGKGGKGGKRKGGKDLPPPQPFALGAEARRLLSELLGASSPPGSFPSTSASDGPSAAAANVRDAQVRATAPANAPANAGAIRDELARLDLIPRRAEMMRRREVLPTHLHREELLATIGGHGVTLLKGATGCGKSTQLPQLLMEHAAAAGKPFKMIVVQPRRLAATALAERVSCEMGDNDGAAGGLVGYQIRGESRQSARTVITFMTTGILLRQLESGGAASVLASLTHLVVDEVHERSVDNDVLLLLLRRKLATMALREGAQGGAQRGAQGGVVTGAAQGSMPRIILMSATVETSLFVDYFNGSNLRRGNEGQGEEGEDGEDGEDGEGGEGGEGGEEKKSGNAAEEGEKEDVDDGGSPPPAAIVVGVCEVRFWVTVQRDECRDMSVCVCVCV